MKLYRIILFWISIALISCKKDNNNATPAAEDKYSSIDDFYDKNEVKSTIYTIDGITGGSFTTNQGTVVTIPPNAFVFQSGTPVNGPVSIEFKDIYKKSDMLLSNMPTMTMQGQPLRSAGEFFIKVTAANLVVVLDSSKTISIEQPNEATGGIDTMIVMEPFVAFPDTNGNFGWTPTTNAYLSLNNLNNYVFSFYQFSSPVSAGSWCNSDNSYYFSNFLQSNLTIQPNYNPDTLRTEVYIIFKNMTSMVHVYRTGSTFQYNYAPNNLLCTIVAIAVQDSSLYATFIPHTIGVNQTVNFSLTKTTTASFKQALEALN